MNSLNIIHNFLKTLNLNKMKPKAVETYKRIKLLGEGSFGKAFLVECESDKVL